MIQPILVTGACGVLGRAITAALQNAGISVRQAARNPHKAQSGVEAVRFDYDDPATIAPALSGAAGLVLMAPPLDPAAAAKLTPAVAAAKSAGVRHIVFISAFGVNNNEQAPLRIVEHLVMDSGIPYTILRPNFFMENFSEGFLASTLKNQSAIFLAAGDGKTSFISVQDIAAAVFAALQAPLANREFDLTGPEALDHAEVARVISENAGRPVAYHALTEEQMVAGARAAGLSEPAIGYLTVLYSVVRAGYAASVTADLQKVAGRRPVTFRDFARNAAAAWK